MKKFTFVMDKQSTTTTTLCEKVLNVQNVEKKHKTEPLEFRVRNMRRKDIPQVLEIYKETGWHTGSHSIYTWIEVDPHAFKVAATHTGKVLGVCCAVRHQQNFYFIGYYIVRKIYRGMGVGFKVWDACMQHIGRRNAGLNAVPEKVELYKTKGGFTVVEDQWLIQENDTTEHTMQPEKLSDIVPDGVTILPFHQSHLPLMFEYDYEVSGYSRKLAVELNCKEKDSKTLVAFKNGTCVGFATVKRSVQNVPQVGPLYADDSTVAETMLRRLLLSYPLKKGFSMVTFTNNKAANSLVKKIGCPPTHKLPRVYKSITQFNCLTQKVFAHFDINCSPV